MSLSPACAGSVAACVHDLLPTLVLLQGACPRETRDALSRVEALAPTLPTLCGNATLQRDLACALAPDGALARLATCAVTYGGVPRQLLGQFSAATLRNFLCGPPSSAVASAPAGAPPPTMYLWVARAALAGAAAATVAVAARRMRRPGTVPRSLTVAALLLWATVWAGAVAGGAAPRHDDLDAGPRFEMEDFYFRDDVTACHSSIARVAPDALVQDRVLTVLAPASRARELYERTMTTTVVPSHGNASLRTLCGHCGLHSADAALVAHLVLGTPWRAAEEAADVSFGVVVPAFAPRAWRRALAAALAPPLDAAGAVFASREQAEADVAASTRVAPAIVGASALLTCATLYASVASLHDAGRRAVPTIALTVAVLSVVLASLALGDAVRAALGVSRSPYAVVVVPVSLGTGVDGALILLSTYRRSGRFDHAWPSIVGSGVTSAFSFVVGLCLPVPHLRALFATCAATFVASTSLGVLVFPPCVRALCPLQVGHDADHLGERRRSARLLWKPALAVLVAVWVAMLPYVRPIGTSADLSYTIARDAMTRRFLDRAHALRAGAAGGGELATAPAVVAALVDDGANWTAAAARIDAVGSLPLVDWHAAFAASGARDLAAWRARAATRLMYGPFFGDGASVVLRTTSGFGDAPTADALRALHSRDGDGVCFARVDCMAEYTVDAIVRRLWVLALAAALGSTVVAVGIAGRHGLAVMPALALSYATMTAVLGATRVPAHMLLVAAYAVSPGFLVDFQIHLAYNPDTCTAVLMSAATSVASMAPYVLTYLPGVRDFAVCYIGFLTLGLLCAFLATVTRSIHKWDAL
jgi:hypothetical protein